MKQLFYQSLLLVLCSMLTNSTAHSLNLPRKQQIVYRNGDGVCAGKWQYKGLESCRVEANGVERYKECRDPSHEVELWRDLRHPDCPVELYKMGTDAQICGVVRVCALLRNRCIQWVEGIFGEGPSCADSEEVCVQYKDEPKSCRDRAFDVELYSSCRTPANGPELHKLDRTAACGVELHRLDVDNSCPGSPKLSANAVNFSSLRQAKSSNRNVIVQAIRENFTGMASACTTCDDLPVNTAAERRAKAVCLRQAIENAESGVQGFDNATLIEAVSASKALLAITEQYDDPSAPSLDPETREYILQTLGSTYPLFRYDNPRYYPRDFELNLVFQNRTGSVVIEGFTRDFGDRYGVKLPFTYGWRDFGNNSPVAVPTINGADTASLDPAFQPYNAYASFTATSGSPAKWEIELPNGKYNVEVGLADLARIAGTAFTVNIEGRPIITNFRPNPFVSFTTATMTVEVRDGRLTVDGQGSTNGAISWLKLSWNSAL